MRIASTAAIVLTLRGFQPYLPAASGTGGERKEKTLPGVPPARGSRTQIRRSAGKGGCASA